MNKDKILIGVVLIILAICAFPFAKPAIEAGANATITTTPGASAFNQYIISNATYWIFGGVIVAALLIILSARNRYE